MKKAWLVLFILLSIPIVNAQLFAVIKPGKQAKLIITTYVDPGSIAYTPCYKIFIADHLYYGCPQTYEQWEGDINTSFKLTYGSYTGNGELSFCLTELQPGEEVNVTVIIDTPAFEAPSKTVWIVLEDKEQPDYILDTKCEVIKVHSGQIDLDWLWEIITNPMFWIGVSGVAIAAIGVSVGLKKK